MVFKCVLVEVTFDGRIFHFPLQNEGIDFLQASIFVVGIEIIKDAP
ncbi:MAG: hypothetical protein AAB947_01295 [Patescibacteria group bacterium]